MKRISGILNKKGFTLIEAISVVVILGLIIGPIFYFYFDTEKDRAVERKKLDAEFKVNRAMKTIIEDMRKAESETIFDNANVTSIYRISPTQLTIRYQGLTGVKRVLYEWESGKINRYDDFAIDAVTGIYTGKNVAPQVLLDNATNFTIQDVVSNAEVISCAYTITVQMTPSKVGNTEISPVVMSQKFVPRFIMDIR